MRIAVRFLEEAASAGVLKRAVRVGIDLHGSLALTGVGHGTNKAVILGLLGFVIRVDVATSVRSSGRRG